MSSNDSENWGPNDSDSGEIWREFRYEVLVRTRSLLHFLDAIHQYHNRWQRHAALLRNFNVDVVAEYPPPRSRPSVHGYQSVDSRTPAGLLPCPVHGKSEWICVVSPCQRPAHGVGCGAPSREGRMPAVRQRGALRELSRSVTERTAVTARYSRPG